MPAKVFLSAGTDAVDAALITKEHALRAFAAEANLPLGRIGAIGDSVNDLPFLTIAGLGLRAAPLNAQPAVRSAIAALDNCVTLSSMFTEALVEFYREAEERGILYIFADKDGVLIWRDDDTVTYGPLLGDLFRNMGSGPHPFIFVLTGSSYEQNLGLLRALRFSPALSMNPSVAAHPFVILAENGAVQINVLTGEIRERTELVDPALLAIVMGPFKRRICQLVEKEILPAFDLSWSKTGDQQVEQLWIPEKRSIVTINIPKTFHDGRDYRSSSRAEKLRRAILECMVKSATIMSIPYEVL